MGAGAGLGPLRLAVRWLGEVEANTRLDANFRNQARKNRKRSYGQQQGRVVAPAPHCHEITAHATRSYHHLSQDPNFGTGERGVTEGYPQRILLRAEPRKPPASREEPQGPGARVLPGGPLDRF